MIDFLIEKKDIPIENYHRKFRRWKKIYLMIGIFFIIAGEILFCFP